MLAELAIVPSAPLLVPELSGRDAAEVDEVRAAVLDAVRSLGGAARTWIAIGVDGPPRLFSAYGVDVPVTASSGRETPGRETSGRGTPDSGSDADPMPLAMLIACWCRGRADAPVELRRVLVDPDATRDEARRLGVDLAAAIAADPEPIGVLVVADGATALSPSAPGGGDRESAHRLQDVIDAAVAAGDVDELAALDPLACELDGVVARPVFAALAGLCADIDVDVDVRYAGAPYGVGYTVATWSPTSPVRARS
ncbi:hypothetical protein L5G28_11755 [Gordonia sp. HY285]|uniref:hypothetical protein n=1 Tax=Gordonia liuliyuniae TaxID=2911517 RepID=UPI001F1A7B55|nr:hypothetical protein [Gordonia liuliyuniae]MCF8610822.1 hypothetical protein [Gordonia liuliyuniae]